MQLVRIYDFLDPSMANIVCEIMFDCNIVSLAHSFPFESSSLAVCFHFLFLAVASFCCGAVCGCVLAHFITLTNSPLLWLQTLKRAERGLLGGRGEEMRGEGGGLN